MTPNTIAFDAANPVACFAAEEWKKYAKLITGRTVSANTSGPDLKNALVLSVVGDRLFKGLPRKIRSEAKKIRHDGFLCGRWESNIFVAAREPRGVLFAVYDLLENEAGVVFGGPHAGEEFIPARDKIVVNRLLTISNPTMPMRIIGLHGGVDEHYPAYPFVWEQMLDWMAKRKFSGFQASLSRYRQRRQALLPQIEKRGILVEVGTHSAFHLLPPETYLKSKPDFFAKDRSGSIYRNLCYSNHAMRQELVRNIIHELDQCPEIGILDLWPPDGAPPCECRRCRTKTPAEWLYETARFVAGRVAGKHPRVLITHLAYDFFTKPPPGAAKLPDNLLVQFCDYWDRIQNRPLCDYRQGRRALKDKAARQIIESHGGLKARNHRQVCEELAEWRGLTTHAGVFTYYGDLIMKQVINNVADVIRCDMAYYEAAGVAAFTDCLTIPKRWINQALTLFALGEFSWDRRQNVPDVIDRFARGVFGVGTEAIVSAYYATLAELLNEPCFLGFNPLDLLHRDPKEIAYFAGVIEPLVQPARERFTQQLDCLRQKTDNLRAVPGANQRSVAELRRATLQLDLQLRQNLALYLAYAYLANGRRAKAKNEIEDAARILDQRSTSPELGERYCETEKKVKSWRKTLAALRLETGMKTTAGRGGAVAESAAVRFDGDDDLADG